MYALVRARMVVYLHEPWRRTLKRWRRYHGSQVLMPWREEKRKKGRVRTTPGYTAILFDRTLKELRALQHAVVGLDLPCELFHKLKLNVIPQASPALDREQR
jgi:hypothetical protein